jgi:hypothetical protein
LRKADGGEEATTTSAKDYMTAYRMCVEHVQRMIAIDSVAVQSRKGSGRARDSRNGACQPDGGYR